MGNLHKTLDQGQKGEYERLRNNGVKAGSKSLEIDERIKKIPDVRTMECQAHAYQVDEKVTIIIVFFDYQFYDLKTVVASVLHNTKHELIEEIIVVDDGSTLDYIKDEAKTFAEKINMMKLIRMTNRVGKAKSILRAVQESKTEELVFLDTNVICTEGWLQPLTELLRLESNAIAVPHYDSINNPISYEYVSTGWELLTTFSWSFTMRTTHDHVTNNQKYTRSVKSPTLRGNAWAIRKQLFIRLGGFDLAMNDPGAESLEFSLRAWMCGATIKVLPCSRVGVLNLKDPVKITIAENIRRIVRLWMPTHKEFVYRHTGITGNMDATEERLLNTRLSELAGLDCKNFDWYIKEIIPDIYTPSPQALSYGLLRCRSGTCARIGEDGRIDLGQCKPDQYKLHPRDMIFERSKAGTITVNGRCVSVTPNAYILVEDCIAGETKQQWELKENGVLRNIWSNYCAMHVTDPDKKVPPGRQILMAQECIPNPDMFVEFEFILP